MLDVLIEHGTVLDGSGRPGVPGDVAITGDRIVAVGHVGHVGADGALRRIDASGMVVAPGFVDPHSHTDWTLNANPTADSTIRQGVTTEIVGNCGVTNAPVSSASLPGVERRLRLFGCDEPPRWRAFGEYLEAVEAMGTSQNLSWFVGHGAIRAAAGVGGTDPSAAGLSRMVALLEEALDAGALGMSTGLEYGEGRFAGRRELLALVAAVGRRGAYHASHIRNRDRHILEAVEEFLDLSRATGARGQISHLNVRYRTGAPPGAWARAVELMSGAVESGMDVQADMTPFEEGLGMMSGLLPDWLVAGGPGRAAELLGDPAVRARARVDSDRYWRFVHAGEWERVRLLHSDQLPELDGLTFPEIAEQLGKDEWEAFFDILHAAGEALEHCLMVGRLFEPADLAEQLRQPLFSCGVDACSSSRTNASARMTRTPLSFCGHVRYLAVHVRERRTIPLEEMVRKLTSLPASRFGLRDRGRLAAGCFADVVVFDPERVASASSFAEPAVYPTGVKAVLVNGRVVVADGSHSGERPGRVLRRAS